MTLKYLRTPVVRYMHVAYPVISVTVFVI